MKNKEWYNKGTRLHIANKRSEATNFEHFYYILKDFALKEVIGEYLEYAKTDLSLSFREWLIEKKYTEQAHFNSTWCGLKWDTIILNGIKT